MSEKNLNFDQPVERRGTHSLKYDFAEERGRKKDILPLWVADMDFKTSSFVQEALIRQAEHGIYGYTESDQEYYDAVSSWMERRHGWKIDKEWITKTPGIVFALAMAVKAYTEPGDYILIQDPVYYPFREVIESNDRKVAANILIRKEDGSYAIDFEDFERQIVEKGVKLFLFCSPHNPVSRVWTREEVERLGDICLKHQVIIVSDEIHADFVFEGKHQVLVDLKDEYKDITVTCTSPGKTFNLAGLQISNIIIPNASLRKEFQHQVTAAGYSQVGAPGIFALIAAYTQGEEWYQAMKQYVKSNIDFLHTWMAEHLPQIKVTKTEGTYLVWMDFRALGLSDKELKELIEDKAEVWLDGGAIFGEPGSGFERINVACQRATLVEALDRIEKAVKENVHPEIMLFLNLAWNGRFMKVSKCDTSKIILDKVIQFFPNRTCRTLTRTCTFRCMILQTRYSCKASFCRMKNGSESVFFRRFCQAVATTFSAKSKDKSLCDKRF